MFVARVRSVVSGKESKEGRREGFFAYLRIRPVHSAAFDTPSFIVARPFLNPFPSLFPFFPIFFFLFSFSKTNQGRKRRIILFQHTGTDGDMRTQRQAGVTRFIHQSCIHRGRERELGGSVHIIFIHHHHRQSKQSKERRKTGGRRRRRRRRRRRGEKPKT